MTHRGFLQPLQWREAPAFIMQLLGTIAICSNMALTDVPNQSEVFSKISLDLWNIFTWNCLSGVFLHHCRWTYGNLSDLRLGFPLIYLLWVTDENLFEMEKSRSKPWNHLHLNIHPLTPMNRDGKFFKQVQWYFDLLTLQLLHQASIILTTLTYSPLCMQSWTTTSHVSSLKPVGL